MQQMELDLPYARQPAPAAPPGLGPRAPELPGRHQAARRGPGLSDEHRAPLPRSPATRGRKTPRATRSCASSPTSARAWPTCCLRCHADEEVVRVTAAEAYGSDARQVLSLATLDAPRGGREPRSPTGCSPTALAATGLPTRWPTCSATRPGERHRLGLHQEYAGRLQGRQAGGQLLQQQPVLPLPARRVGGPGNSAPTSSSPATAWGISGAGSRAPPCRRSTRWWASAAGSSSEEPGIIRLADRFRPLLEDDVRLFHHWKDISGQAPSKAGLSSMVRLGNRHDDRGPPAQVALPGEDLGRAFDAGHRVEAGRLHGRRTSTTSWCFNTRSSDGQWGGTAGDRRPAGIARPSRASRSQPRRGRPQAQLMWSSTTTTSWRTPPTTTAGGAASAGRGGPSEGQAGGARRGGRPRPGGGGRRQRPLSRTASGSPTGAGASSSTPPSPGGAGARSSSGTRPSPAPAASVDLTTVAAIDKQTGSVYVSIRDGQRIEWGPWVRAALTQASGRRGTAPGRQGPRRGARRCEQCAGLGTVHRRQRRGRTSCTPRFATPPGTRRVWRGRSSSPSPTRSAGRPVPSSTSPPPCPTTAAWTVRRARPQHGRLRADRRGRRSRGARRGRGPAGTVTRDAGSTENVVRRRRTASSSSPY